MFSLCTKVKNIILDIDSFDDAYLESHIFVQLLYDFRAKYNLILLGIKKDSLIETEIIKTDISKYSSFSSFIKEFKIIPMYSIVITNSMKSVDQAHKLNLSTILISKTNKIDDFIQEHKHLPDKILDIETVRKLLIDNELHGNFNELSVQQTEGSGCIYPLGEIPHQLFGNIKANLIFSGRYFVNNDPRSYIHCLSKIILRLKDFKSYAAESLAFCLNMNIKMILQYEDINLITVVPAKPGKDNHLDLLLSHTKLNEFKSIIDTNVLYTVRDYGKQKQAGSFKERAINVQNAFESRRDTSGHVLLIDDILTSGSTAMECAKVLYNHGAEKVTILPLAIMQSNSNAPSHGKVKDEFDEEYRLNFRNRDGVPFWVASEGQFLEYGEGKELYLEQNGYGDHQVDELPF